MNVLASDSYSDYLISRLQDPEEAAAYIEAILEEQDPEPELLKVALVDVVQALGPSRMTPDQAKSHQQEVENLLAEDSQVIYRLAAWLQQLGLRLTVTTALEEHK